MCNWCGVQPCTQTCPNREASVVLRCAHCATALYEADWYIASPAGPLCEDCAHEMLLRSRCRVDQGEQGGSR